LTTQQAGERISLRIYTSVRGPSNGVRVDEAIGTSEYAGPLLICPADTLRVVSHIEKPSEGDQTRSLDNRHTRLPTPRTSRYALQITHCSLRQSHGALRILGENRYYPAIRYPHIRINLSKER